jgi:hypothetical protein
VREHTRTSCGRVSIDRLAWSHVQAPTNLPTLSLARPPILVEPSCHKTRRASLALGSRDSSGGEICRFGSRTCDYRRIRGISGADCDTRWQCHKWPEDDEDCRQLSVGHLASVFRLGLGALPQNRPERAKVQSAPSKCAAQSRPRRCISHGVPSTAHPSRSPASRRKRPPSGLTVTVLACSDKNNCEQLQLTGPRAAAARIPRVQHPAKHSMVAAIQVTPRAGRENC